MNRLETTIAERLRAAAERIPVDMDPTAVVGSDHMTVVRRPPGRRRLAVGAVAVAASVVAVLVAVRPDPAPPTVEAGPAAPGSETAPAVLLPHVAYPPDWFGEPQAAQRSGGLREGRWVSMAIGQVAGEDVRAPIVVSVFDGSYRPLDDAEPVTIGGLSLESVEIGEWRALATTDTPTVLVTGATDEDTLVAVLRAVEVTDPAGNFSLRLRSVPEGYEAIVEPTVLGPDGDMRRTLASEGGDTGINEVSDCVEPLLCAAFSGAHLVAVDIDGTTGWMNTTSHPFEGLQFVVWAPRRGVVFEISAWDDGTRTMGELVDLAHRTSAVEPEKWEEIHAG